MYPPRQDYPGARWFITNRGIAKRAVFETRQDAERFYAALRDVVALGLVEVHAFVLMTTLEWALEVHLRRCDASSGPLAGQGRLGDEPERT